MISCRKLSLLLTLPDELQQRLGTTGGPAGVGTLARLASTFSGGEAVELYERISGFTQRIQEEKRSGGNLDTIDDLVEEAQEGAFDVRRCGGAYACEVIRDIAQRRLSQADFQKLVGDVTATLNAPEPSDNCLREAARTFWKALAAG